PVVLAFTAVDFIHGFFIPDLKIRADLLPGQLTQVRLTPGKAGEYAFLCDNFCGSGHEEMNGKIIVTE
ncbi:cupredoxin domain-containing protein, partial [Gemella sp. 19428wG2_WT2a]